jgi:hypothetical protein
VLENDESAAAHTVRRRFSGTLSMMSRWAPLEYPQIRDWIAVFRKVSRSYGAGLFFCYDVPSLPRTNNDLEQYFGRYRIVERRITGHKVSSPRTVTRGSVRLEACLCTRARSFASEDLVPQSMDSYYALRRALKNREQPRREQLRFRRSPEKYLNRLETLALMPTLPP